MHDKRLKQFLMPYLNEVRVKKFYMHEWINGG